MEAGSKRQKAGAVQDVSARFNAPESAKCPAVPYAPLLLTRVAVSLSSSGGEGQGEEVVAFGTSARCIRVATCGNIVVNHNSEKADGPPLPNPLLQRRRGETCRRLLG
jgi:hypothetical protein